MYTCIYVCIYIYICIYEDFPVREAVRGMNSYSITPSTGGCGSTTRSIGRCGRYAFVWYYLGPAGWRVL